MAWQTVKIAGYEVHYLRQKANFSCAPTCVAMVLANNTKYKADDKLERHTRYVAYSQVSHVKAKYGGKGSPDENFGVEGMTPDHIGRLLGMYRLDGTYYHGANTAEGINLMKSGEAALFASEAHVVCLLKKPKGLILLDPAMKENCGLVKGKNPAHRVGPGCFVGEQRGFGFGGEHCWRIRRPSLGRY